MFLHCSVHQSFLQQNNILLSFTIKEKIETKALTNISKNKTSDVVQ